MKNFIFDYRNNYKAEPSQVAIHGYDVGFYFLSILNCFGTNFEDCIYNYHPKLLQANYKFVRWNRNSGCENTGVSMIKYYDDYVVSHVK